MITLHPQYVVDDSKQCRSVLLPVEEWEEILKALEELDDICVYDAAKAGPQESIPFEQAVHEIQEKYNP